MFLRRRSIKPGQRRIEDISVPRSNYAITLEAPLPNESVFSTELKNEIDRIAKTYHYRIDVLSRTEGFLTHVELFDVTEQHKNDIEDMVDSAISNYKGIMERTGQSEDKPSMVPLGRGGGMDWEHMAPMCSMCPRNLEDRDGNRAKRVFANCVAMSRLNRGEEGTLEFRREKRDHIKPEVTREMDLGSKAHVKLFFARGPTTDVYEAIERLARGERVSAVIPFCIQERGARGRPDLLVMKLTKVELGKPIMGPDGNYSMARSGWLLQIVVVEDKRIVSKELLRKLKPQLRGEAIAMTSEHVLMHDSMPYADDKKSMETPGTRLIPELISRMQIPITEVLHVEVFTALNAYWDTNNPVDSYSSWVLKGPRPAGIKAPLPELWSVDHVVIPRQKWNMVRTLARRNELLDALEELQTGKPTTQTELYHTEDITRRPIFNEVEAESLKLIRPRTEEELRVLRELRRKRAEERVRAQADAVVRERRMPEMQPKQ